jgi:hypothetical protein
MICWVPDFTRSCSAVYTRATSKAAPHVSVAAEDSLAGPDLTSMAACLCETSEPDALAKRSVDGDPARRKRAGVVILYTYPQRASARAIVTRGLAAIGGSQ